MLAKKSRMGEYGEQQRVLSMSFVCSNFQASQLGQGFPLSLVTDGAKLFNLSFFSLGYAWSVAGRDWRDNVDSSIRRCPGKDHVKLGLNLAQFFFYSLSRRLAEENDGARMGFPSSPCTV